MPFEYFSAETTEKKDLKGFTSQMNSPPIKPLIGHNQPTWPNRTLGCVDDIMDRPTDNMAHILYENHPYGINFIPKEQNM